MDKLRTLEARAAKIFKARGHTPGPWRETDKGYNDRIGTCYCDACKAWVQVMTLPVYGKRYEIGGPGLDAECHSYQPCAKCVRLWGVEFAHAGTVETANKLSESSTWYCASHAVELGLFE